MVLLLRERLCLHLKIHVPNRIRTFRQNRDLLKKLFRHSITRNRGQCRPASCPPRMRALAGAAVTWPQCQWRGEELPRCPARAPRAWAML
eukprot:1157706-Pelagomonas_calceolata.AAC.6